ncbi:MAG: stage II sporulation protein R [Eubacterium sp.]|jgi:stage II sporulation protein R|nr:stage II sporulation protein R [Eubacterium sp.]
MKNLFKTKDGRLTSAMLIGTAMAIIFSSFYSFSEECEELKSEILRLHILANSNSKADQDLKYALRDELLSYSAELFAGAKTKEQAKKLAALKKTAIERKANEFVKSKGFDYAVRIDLKETYFTTRKYDGITVPAGFYDAVRVFIGEGQGKNWWCVMFPPLCLPACTEPKDQKEPFFSAKMSRQAEENNDIEIRFAIYDLLSGALKK